MVFGLLPKNMLLAFWFCALEDKENTRNPLASVYREITVLCRYVLAALGCGNLQVHTLWVFSDLNY